jgi:hypothetical protein
MPDSPPSPMDTLQMHRCVERWQAACLQLNRLVGELLPQP